MDTAAFQKTIWDFYRKNRRDMPWRSTKDPYRIFVSEVMLQQTQVSRVIPKYIAFIERFPSFRKLAQAPFSDVLALWKGLGYNRRALNLKRAAEIIDREYHGKLPKTAEELRKLPGIGPNTAGSLLAFAHAIPVPFIETNIRSVFIHFFFQDRAGVHDTEIMPLIDKTLDRSSPRDWYCALMDYGAMLKLSANPNLRSRHYVRQSPFKGSRRELRAKILDHVLTHPGSSVDTISKTLGIEREKALEIVVELQQEGFLAVKGGRYTVAA